MWFKNLVFNGKKLFLKLELKILRLLYPHPDGSNEKRGGWCGYLMILAACGGEEVSDVMD